MKNFDKVFISCGGTGGHFYPGLAIARTLKHDGKHPKLLLSGINAEAQAETAKKFNVESIVLPWMPSPGHSPLRWCQFLKGVISGTKQVRREIRDFRPDLMISMGSFAGAPAVLGAKKEKVAIVLHDGNAHVGKANRFFSRWAEMIGTAFPPVNAGAVHCPLNVTGMPVRPELEQQRFLTKEEAIEKLNDEFGARLRDERFTILVFGGSQGASSINKVLPAVFSEMNPEKIQVIHLTGKGKLEETQARYEKCKFAKLLLEADEHMGWFLAAADLAVSRAGGSSVAELALFRKPAILVPYPYAAENHQEDNADFYVQSGAGVKVIDQALTPIRALEVLKAYLDDPDRVERSQAGASSCAYPEAAKRFLDAVAKMPR